MFAENVITKELRTKTKRLTELREEDPLLHFACILRTIATLCKEPSSVDEWLHKKDLEASQQQRWYRRTYKNLSSFKLPFFQKLPLYRSLDMNFEILKKIVRVNSSV